MKITEKRKPFEAKCPICHKAFQEWYCPLCGLPISTFHRKRPEYSSSEFQLCDKCNTPNPYGAKYCKNCGENITLHAKDKNGHGWIDLGLSVLWSTETMRDFYLWNHSKALELTSDTSKYVRFEDIDNKDVATTYWGEKWRTPTKEEFEELFKRCKWEKCIDSITNKHALKAIGPNGNSIIIPVTGYAGCNIEHDLFTNKTSIVENEAIYSTCSFWTSTEDTKKNNCAYAFNFIGYKGFKPTLTAREKKEREFKNEKSKRKFESSFKGFGEIDEDYWKPGISEKKRLLLKQTEQKWQLERQREEEEWQVLRAMGDDRQEKADNIRKDQERRHRLWLDTPIEMSFDNERQFLNTIRPIRKNSGLAIRPVADKQWKGKL